MQNTKKSGSILILISFILESFLIIPLLWTIPGFILYSKINHEKATEGQIMAFAILGIIFGTILGVIGGILMLLDSKNATNKEHVITSQQTTTNNQEQEKTEV